MHGQQQPCACERRGISGNSIGIVVYTRSMFMAMAMAMAVAVAMVLPPSSYAQQQDVGGFDSLPGSFGEAEQGGAALALLQQLQELQGMLEKYQISLPTELLNAQASQTLVQEYRLINERIMVLQKMGELLDVYSALVDKAQRDKASLPPQLLLYFYKVGIGDLALALNPEQLIQGDQQSSQIDSGSDDADISDADRAGLALVDDLVKIHWASNMDGGDVLPEQPVRLVASFGGEYYEIKTGDRIAGFEIGAADDSGVGVMVFRGEDTFALKF